MYTYSGPSNVLKQNKKLSCRREAARRPLEILQSLSMSLKVIRSYTVGYGMCKFPLAFSIP